MKLNRPASGFPLMFEVLVWIIYVCMYKYSYFLELSHTKATSKMFPFPQLMLYSAACSLYLIPLYRFIIPHLMKKGAYLGLFGVTVLHLAFASKINYLLADLIFAELHHSGPLAAFFQERLALSSLRIRLLFAGWDLNLIVTDVIAFSCIAFVRFAFHNESRRHELEQNNLILQLEMLKTQLQPHFLFNTLNSIYSFSIMGSPDTPKFILLLSDMMRYILYECRKDYVSLSQEIGFMKDYFDMEQKKYPGAGIVFAVDGPANWSVPPLLFLPLIENSFKHGAHHMCDSAEVRASLKAGDTKIEFCIENDVYKNEGSAEKTGGIGTVNIQQRLDLYYPGKYKLSSSFSGKKHKTELLIFV